VRAESRQTAPRRARGLTRAALLDWVVGGAVVALALTVQLAFRQGPQPFDPAIYFAAAAEFPDVPANLWTLRIGLVAPVRGAVLLFGSSEAALYTVPIATGLLLAAAVYGTMVVLFHDRLLGAAAALVTVLNPVYLLRSSSIFPDTTATATFTAGFLCLVLGGMRSDEPTRRWAPRLYALGAGVLFGWTYLIREFSPVLLPVVLAGVVLLRYPLRRVALLCGAALATAGLELLHGFLRYGEPLVHARLLADRGETPRAGAGRVENVDQQLDSVLDTIAVFPRLLLAWRVGWIFILLAAVFLVALVARRRDRRLWLLAIWCFGFWLSMAVLGLASPSSERWIDITSVRYWLPMLPPLVMGAFGGLALLFSDRVRSIGGVSLASAVTVAVGVVALAPGLVEFRSCPATQVWANDPIERWDDLRSWFATAEAERYDVVWTDRNTRRLVPAFTSSTFGAVLWDGSVKEFEDVERGLVPASDHRRSLILVHKDRFEDDVPSAGSRLDELRLEWAPILVSEDGEMVLLARRAQTSTVRPEQAWWSLSDDRGDRARPGSCGVRPY
jgi:hypothetical protein